MKRFTRFAHCLLAAALLSAPAHAEAPAAPAVSVTAGLKQLNFFWNRVPGATRVELWFLPLTGGTWVKYADLPGGRTRVSVNISGHLLQWNESRYQVKACNAEGCGSSPLLAVSHLMQQTVGRLAAPAGTPFINMGWTTDMSEFGTTLAAATDADESGAVEVFRKTPGGWAHEAQLLADPKEAALYYQTDPSVSVSGNGDVIALGVDGEVRPGVDVEAEPRTGAVYLFRRTHAGWVREQKLTFPAPMAEDGFGRRVDLDESGTLLAAWRRFGDPPYAAPGPWNHQGLVELFKYDAGAWVRHATIPVVSEECTAIALSGDGNTLVRSCGSRVEVFKAPTWQRVASLPHEVYGMAEFSIDVRAMAINFDGTSFAVRSVTLEPENWEAYAWVNVYRLGASGWVRDASLAPGPWTEPGPMEDPHAGYGFGVAMSRDGRFLAVGANRDPAIGSGVLYPPINGTPSDYGKGAVYVYERKPSGWRLRQFIKPNTESAAFPSFGRSLSFARNGKDLAVSAHYDGRGVVWLY